LETGLQNRYGPVRSRHPPKKIRSGVVSFVGTPQKPLCGVVLIKVGLALPTSSRIDDLAYRIRSLKRGLYASLDSSNFRHF
jgi:hypothetical protein